MFNKNIELCELINSLIEKLYELEHNGGIVQSQPLGMMRIALDGQKNADNGLFLHFWAPDLPKSMDNPPIHTHVFNLKSRIITGKIKDISYKTIPDSFGQYQLIQAKCTQEYCSMINILDRVRLETKCIREFSKGDIYEIPKGSFHVTSFTQENQTAITIMEKTDADLSDPVLVLPYQTKVDIKPFDRMQLNQKEAWKRINNTLTHLIKAY
jgi:hypothetical protein